MPLLVNNGDEGGAVWTPPPGLAAWWYGDSLTAGNWTDRSGNGQHATLVGSPTMSADGMTCASGKYAYIADSPSMLTNGALCAWVRVTNRANTQVFVGAWTDPYEYLLSMLNGTWMLHVGYNNTQATAGEIPANTWTHTAMRWTGTHVIAYLNGTAGTPAAQSTQRTHAHRLWLGTFSGTTLPLLGQLTDAMVYTSDPGAAAIADIAANSPGRPA